MGRDRHQNGWVTEKAGNLYGHFTRYVADPTTGTARRKHECIVLGPKSKLRKWEAKDELRLIITRQLGPQQPVARRDPDTSFETFVLNVYIPMRAGNWRPVTRSFAEYHIRRYLMPDLGRLALKDIDGICLQLFLNKLAGELGFSGSIVKKCHLHLKAIMKLARKQKYLIEDPAEDLRIPRTKEPEKPTISWQQINLMLDNLENPRDRCLFGIAVFCALRTHEIFGLRWGSYQGDSLMISDTAWKGTLYPNQVKTDASRAPVPIPDELQPLIARWREQCPDTSPEALMFPARGKRRNLGKLVPFTATAYMERHIQPIAKKLGIPTKLVTIRVLRRTAATDLQKFGTVKDNQSFLRHSSPTTALVHYVQTIPGSLREAVNARAHAVRCQSQTTAMEENSEMAGCIENKPRRHFPYDVVAQMWAEGKLISEIAHAIGYFEEGKKDPCLTLRKVINRMHKGYRNSKNELSILPYRRKS